MTKDDPKRKSLFEKIPGKLTALIGGGLAVLHGVQHLDAKPVVANPSNTIKAETVGAFAAKPLPAKLVLRNAGAGFNIIAQHASHSSHSPHSSPSSHSSPDAHSSHS